MSERVLHEWTEGGSNYRLVGDPPHMEWKLPVDGHEWKTATMVVQSGTLLDELACLAARIAELAAENAKLRKKLLRVRDWLKFEANADSGICSEIDDAARAEVDK